ncbi:MAG: PEGA domain-containing protein, partial [Deltaproteobacteria bacterium]|nr:PEGA domain-containing protein [Deltaproteobacteria bacterium]
VVDATPTGTGFSLETEPSGAKVFIDGTEIEQRTPVTLPELAIGSHTIRVENGARYAPWETQVDVRADTIIPLRAELELARITVSFVSEPSGATVTLVRGSTRRNVGRTPTSADVDLTGDGAWEVEFELSGHESVTRPITPVAGDDELEVEIALEAQRVAVRQPRIAPRPRPRPRPTPTPTPTPAGSHRLTLVNSEFNIRETVSVQVRPGEVTTKIITLTPGG